MNSVIRFLHQNLFLSLPWRNQSWYYNKTGYFSPGWITNKQFVPLVFNFPHSWILFRQKGFNDSYLGSISPTFYVQHLRTLVSREAFLCLHFRFVLYWCKTVGAKSAHRTLITLNPNVWWKFFISLVVKKGVDFFDVLQWLNVCFSSFYCISILVLNEKFKNRFANSAFSLQLKGSLFCLMREMRLFWWLLS